MSMAEIAHYTSTIYNIAIGPILFLAGGVGCGVYAQMCASNEVGNSGPVCGSTSVST